MMLISKVIWAHRSVSLNVTKEITEGIDRPSKSYDVTNGFKGKLRGSVTAGSVVLAASPLNIS